MVNVNWQDGADSFIDAISSEFSVPGGGSAAAISGAIGVALLLMSGGVTIRKKSTDENTKQFLRPVLDNLFITRETLKQLAKDDAKAYDKVLKMKKLPQGNERDIKVAEAIIDSATIPLKTAKQIQDAIKSASLIEDKIAKIIFSDLICAKIILKGALQCCVENIKINTPFISDEKIRNNFEKEIKNLLEFLENI